MKDSRVQNITNKMKEEGYDQLLISDPTAIFYLTGLWIHPGERLLVLVIRADGKNTLVVNKLFPITEDIGIEKVFIDDIDDGVKKVLDYCDVNGSFGIDKNWPSHFLLHLMELVPNAKLGNGSEIIDDARAIKDEEEKDLMRKAQADNELATDFVKHELSKDLTEIEITERLGEKYKELGDSGYSFDPIIAYGANGADPHHQEPDDSRLKPGDSIVVDIGCVRDSYCSDMTRTFFYKEVSDKSRDVYETILEGKRRAMALIKPGVELATLDAAARDYITEKGYGEYFTHRLGHFIGIEDHETGDVSTANHNVCEVGNIFSIEPGVYIPGEVGVRIEDLVIVTEDGYENLNKYPDDLEIIQ
ncbi:xaa-Pro dipeptidase [Companilactobacillus tucceti DSM 20183]|uniref:Xaa-Pro dipeptidase n=1 Tax=Companilactobacillus tucceti DSM 20183 TaxID=1423811 RepID=A0A0R1IWY7_9LACO|nr:Xaa-Pro peptidase family protein [Companilactobacillus tucceti]KRK63813.1 xaa-Pro dipeptidase [Companilactobacillus tucceti DSM 20183]